MANDNKLLGTFVLQGIPPSPRGVPQIEVAFDLDANGILHVSAKDLGTGKQQSIQIIAANKLDEKEVDQMKKMAEEYAETDKKRKEEVETVNQADSTVYQTEKMLEEMKEKVSENTKKKIMEQVDKLKELLGKEPKPVSQIKSTLDQLNKDLMKIGQEIYQKTGKQPNPMDEMEKNTQTNGGNDADEKPDDNVVDADYEVHDEDEKPKKKK